MLTHQIRYFVAVARMGNFSRAAEVCHVSQPSLSQQIQKLEEELGQRLFHRLRKQVVLTPAGRILMKRAVRILDEIESARREVQQTDRTMHGRVTAGILPTIAPYFLPGVLASFRRKFSSLEVIIEEETTQQLLHRLETGELDLALLSRPIPPDRFAMEDLLEEAFHLALPPGHPLAGREEVGLEELRSEQFILLKDGHCAGEQALAFCHEHDFQPRVLFRSGQMETIRAMIQAGLGVSLIPAMACPNPGREIVYQRLALPPTRSITVAWRKQQQHCRAITFFLEELRAAAAKRRALLPSLAPAN
jgi:LysR family transcriptional regulator, hydrogen peroxide-inducible genes activator